MIPWMVWDGTTLIGRMLARSIEAAYKNANQIWPNAKSITITPIVEIEDD